MSKRKKITVKGEMNVANIEYDRYGSDSPTVVLKSVNIGERALAKFINTAGNKEEAYSKVSVKIECANELLPQGVSDGQVYAEFELTIKFRKRERD